MYYLALDTNIWLNLLKEGTASDNSLNFLDHWIDGQHIKILLPEIIVTEWKRNRENKKKVLIQDWRDFLNRAKKIFDSSYVNDVITSEYVEQRVEKQLEIVEDIFDNHAIVIPITENVKLKSVEKALEKKAPFHRKSSMADALILHSFLDYIESQQLMGCFFITNNTDDFSETNSKSKIHSDLKDEFNKLGVRYFTDIKRAIYIFKTELQLPEVIDERSTKNRRNEIQKISEAISNPESTRILDSLEDSYLDNIQHIDIVLGRNKPTKSQVKFVLDLIKSDVSYEKYFFRKVSDLLWFDILRDEGYFDPDKNPAPRKVDDGFQIPYWDVLNYLERVATQISEGKHPELIDKLVDIIDAVSEQPKDNYRTWHSFIEILACLPNEYVPVKLLNHIPLWLKTQFSSGSQTSSLFEKLLPKFLNDDPTTEDVEKAERIAIHMTDLIKVEIEVDETAHWGQKSGYALHADLYWLKNGFVEKGIAEKLAKYGSNNVIFHIANNLKKLLLDHYNGIPFGFISNDRTYQAKFFIEGDNLSIVDIEYDQNHQLLSSKIVFDSYLKHNKDELKILIKEKLNEQGIIHEKDSEDTFNLNQAVGIAYNDSSRIWCHSLHEFEKEYHDTPREILALILRDLTNHKAKYNESAASELIQRFAITHGYNLPFFKRLSLYILSKNWSVTLKPFFWEMIDKEDEKHYFSSPQYSHELYCLLQQNIKSFNASERAVIKQIIENGPQDEKEERHENYINRWRLRWYSAMKKDQEFKNEYEKLSAKLERSSEDFENEGKIQTRVGYISPLSVEDVLEMDNQDIVSYIRNFNPERSWESPSIEGLSDTIQNAVAQTPQKFDQEINLYIDTYHAYAYRIVQGFIDAWKNEKDFDWKKVLTFCLSYISNPAFDTDDLNLTNDDLGTNANWVRGAIANLIQDGTRSDRHAFSAEYLPIAREILFKLIPQLEVENDLEKTNMDYPNYSLNSTAGKLLHALLNYSLRKVRVEEGTKWDQEAQLLFEQAMNKGLIDPYVLQGWYFPQFYYLNKDWIIDQTKKHYDLEDNFWKAFMGGVSFRSPMSGKEMYELMYPHYLRAIEKKMDFKGHDIYGIARHLATFFFWGYEDTNDDKLISKFLRESNPKQIQNLVHFIASQNNFMSSLESEEERQAFSKKITALWSFILNKYQGEDTKDATELISGLSKLTALFREINESNKNLIQTSAKIINSGHNSHSFLIELNRLKDTGEPTEKAKDISVIMQEMPILIWLTDKDKKHIIALTIFLYENNERESANQFCNRYSKEGMDFLRSTYEKYNS